MAIALINKFPIVNIKYSLLKVSATKSVFIVLLQSKKSAETKRRTLAPKKLEKVKHSCGLYSKRFSLVSNFVDKKILYDRFEAGRCLKVKLLLPYETLSSNLMQRQNPG